MPGFNGTDRIGRQWPRRHDGTRCTVVRMRKLAITGGAYAIAVLCMALFVRPITLPDENAGMAADAGPVNALLHETSGKAVPTDILLDYASAKVLRHGGDPYGLQSAMIDRIGAPAWPVENANPHPPTMIALMLPFSALSYQNALSAWSILMIVALIGTVHLVGVRLAYAAPIGLAIAATFPGAYGVGNAVPVIGLGVAIAYRYRHNPLMAAVGLTLAAAPKSSGLLLVLPFLLTRRWRAVGWTAGFMLVLCVVPELFFRGTWSAYLDAGADAISVNADRPDNASILNLASKHGISQGLVVALVLAAAIVVAVRIRDSFWPIVWLMVVALPIAWMYSLLTLIPLACVVLRRRTAVSVGAVALAAALTVGTPPLGMWPTRILPIVVLLTYIGLTQIRETEFWPEKEIAAIFNRFRRGSGTPVATVDA